MCVVYLHVASESQTIDAQVQRSLILAVLA